MLRLLATGKTNSEIAAELIVGETTVETHVTRILISSASATASKRSFSPTRLASSVRVSRP